MQVPEGKVHARVEGGWVTLDGEVEWGFQRHEVERMVRQVRGVIGVTDNILVNPPTSPQSVEAVIEETFKREAEIDARHIRVEYPTIPPSSTVTCIRCRRQTRREPRQRRRAESPRWRAIWSSLRSAS